MYLFSWCVWKKFGGILIDFQSQKRGKNCMSCRNARLKIGRDYYVKYVLVQVSSLGL